MRKLVKLATLALAYLGADSLYRSYRNAKIDNVKHGQTSSPLNDVMHDRV